MNTPNFTSLLTALRAFVLKSRPAYKDYLGTESVEEKTVLLTGTLSATGESVTAADGFTGFTNGQTYKATIGDETVEVTAQYGTGSFSGCIVIGSSNVAPSDTIPGWMVCVYNGNLLGFGTGDWAGKQIEVVTSKMVSVQKWDTKKLPEECLPEKMPENWAEALDNLSDDDPLPAGTATPGTSDLVSRADHVHPKEVSDEDRASWNAKLDETDLVAFTKEEIDEMWNPPVALKFSSPEPFALSVANSTKNWNGTLEYSTDAKTWTEWDGTTTLNSGNNKLYVRGTGNSVISDGYSGRWKLIGENISCSGNIETLLDWQAVAQGIHPSMEQSCFNSMFNGCTSLISTPTFPTTALSVFCYAYMFNGCTSLTTVPELPTTTLVYGCYYFMFVGCSKIKLSTTQTDEYTQEYRIPTSGTGTVAGDATTGMLRSTGGTFTDDPAINTTYYLHKDNSIVPAI